MKLGALFLAAMVVVVMMIPLSSGDGTPLITKKLLGVTHENRQIAMIDVHKNYERIHLFLSVVSLDPGSNITILIPVKTEPSNISIVRTVDWKFAWWENMTQVNRYSDEVNAGYYKFENNYLFGSGLLTIVPFFFYGGVYIPMYLMSTGAGGSASSEETIHFEGGDTITVYNVTSEKDINRIYEKYNATLPENIKNTLNRYSSYHLIALNARTLAPISEEKYQVLQEKCPKSIEKLKEYVNTHPVVNITLIYNDILNMPEYSELYDFVKNESHGNHTLIRYFTEVVLAIYGYGDMRGVVLNMTLPLYNDKAFYPLGTSPAWNSSGKIRVWFKVKSDHELHPNISPDLAISYRGYRYYRWKLDNQLPDKDIEVSMSNLSFSSLMGDVHDHAGIWLSHYGDFLGFVAGILTTTLLWFFIYYMAVLIIYDRKSYFGRKDKFKLVAMATILNFFATVATGLFYFYYITARKHEKYGGKLQEKRLRISAIYFFSVMSVTFILGVYLFYYASYAWMYPPPAHVPPLSYKIFLTALGFSLLTLQIPLIVILVATFMLKKEKKGNDKFSTPNTGKK